MRYIDIRKADSKSIYPTLLLCITHKHPSAELVTVISIKFCIEVADKVVNSYFEINQINHDKSNTLCS